MSSRTLSRRGLLKSSAGASAFLTMASCGGARAPVTGDDWIDGVETAARIKSGDLTAVEAVSAAIDRAKTVNPAINALVADTFDSARSAAAEGRAGPFGGVPSFVKDLTDVIGQPTHYGSRAFKGYVAERQSAFADAYLASGFISIGKSATPELGITATTEPLSHGPTRNPWNLNHSAGGSSGGAAALVAAGVTPIAHASDGAGSIRIPASNCGLVGLKSTRGRLPSGRLGDGPPLELSVQGCLSRTVRDTAAFLAAISAAAGSEKPIRMVTGPARARLKIGFHIDPVVGVDVAPEVVAAVRQAAVLCEDLGHEVEEIATPYDASFAGDMKIYFAGLVAGGVAEWSQMSGRAPTYSDFEPLTFDLVRFYEAHKSQMPAVTGRLVDYARVFDGAFGEKDILLSPTLATPAPEIGFLRTDLDWETMWSRVLSVAPFTQAQNVAGVPAISLPLAQTPGGLPIGAQFTARSGADEMLLELAYELEEAAPWIDRKPPLFAGGEGAA
ncbi:MAG: amidase [Pseudomonadota bacterium]